MKYYVTSDVHGFYTPFRDVLERGGFFTDPAPHKLVILGDLFDRGEEARAMQKFVLELLRQEQVILVKGNHEDLFTSLITEDGGRILSHHLHNGTYDTALQLTGMKRSIALADPYGLAEAAQNTVYYRNIIPKMLNYYETQNFIFVHGWIPCIQERDGTYSAIENWRDAGDAEWSKARWYNGMAASRPVRAEGKTIVCGHWHSSFGHSQFEGKGSEFGEDADFSPYFGEGVIAIDACTAHSGMVNCVVIEDEPLEQEKIKNQ